MKARTFFSSLLILVLVLVVVGLGGFWELTAQSPVRLIKRGGQPLPKAAVLVPKNAPLMASLLVRPDRLTTLWQLQSGPRQRRQTMTEIDRIRTVLLSGSGLSYDEDIRPWLGEEVTFAVTAADGDQDPSNGQHPGYLLVLSCLDSDQAKAALEMFWQRRALAGGSLIFEQFAGSKLIYTRPLPLGSPSGSGPQPPSAIASAMVGKRFVLLANDPAVLKQALTNAQSGDLNLDQDQAYRMALGSLSANRVGLVFLNIPQDLAWLGFSPPPPITPGMGDQDDVFDRSLLSLRLDPAGLIADVALLAAGGHQFHPRTAGDAMAADMLQYLPETAPLVAVGRDLAGLWQSLSQTLAIYVPSFHPVETVLQALDAPLALEAESSLTGWIDGDYALGLVPTGPQTPPDWILAAQHQAHTAAAVEHLDELARQQGLSVGSLRLPGQQSVMAWSHLAVSPEKNRDRLQVTATVTALHAQIKDVEVFSTSPTAMNTALQASSSALADQATWQSAIRPLTDPHGGILYLDWPQIKPSLLKQSAWLRLADAIAQPLSQRLKSVAVTSYGGDEKLQHGGIFFRLSNS